VEVRAPEGRLEGNLELGNDLKDDLGERFTRESTGGIDGFNVHSVRVLCLVSSYLLSFSKRTDCLKDTIEVLPNGYRLHKFATHVGFVVS
jgi:hypothetical protein